MKKTTIRLVVTILILLMMLSMAPAALAETAQALQRCWVYSGPDESSQRLGYLDAGDHVTVNFAQGRFSDITIANLTGYVLSSNLGPAVSSRLIPVITSNPVPVIPQPVPVIPQPTPVPVIPQPTPVPVIPQPVPVIPQQPVPVIPQQPVPVIGSSTNLYTTTNLNVRTGPSTKYAKIGVLRAGSPVLVIDTVGSWYKINYNGIQAYVSSKYVQKGNAVVSGYVAPMNTTMITTSVATAYKGTGKHYGEVCAFPAGYPVQVVGVCGNWYKILVSGQYGYIQRTYLCDPGSIYVW